jgi:Zn-dependent oligopeptidase
LHIANLISNIYCRVRAASTAAVNKLEEFSVEQRTREDLYKAVLEYIDNNPDAVSKLEGEDKRLLEKTIQSFKRNGLALETEQRIRVKQIKQRISQLAIKFQQNLNEDTTKLFFTREELAGLPDDFIENLAKENDKFAVSLKVTYNYHKLFIFSIPNFILS